MPEKLITDALPLLLTDPVYLLREDLAVADLAVSETESPAVTEPVRTLKPPAENSIPPIAQTSPPFTVWKRNRNRVVIIYNNQQTVYLNPDEETLLAKILAAVKLQIEDVELVNIHNHRESLAEILKDKLVNQLISFGIELRELDIRIPLTAYRVTRVEGIDILLADSLFELQLNTDKKKMLWHALQGMFLLKR